LPKVEPHRVFMESCVPQPTFHESANSNTTKGTATPHRTIEPYVFTRHW